MTTEMALIVALSGVGVVTGIVVVVMGVRLVLAAAGLLVALGLLAGVGLALYVVVQDEAPDLEPWKVWAQEWVRYLRDDGLLPGGSSPEDGGS